jgi:C-terminal processing protease CtpA/Prc
MKLIAIFLLLLTFCNTSYAAEKGKRGFITRWEIVGFFSPEIKSAKIKSVEPNSNAEKIGIKVGDRLIAINDCLIPGCSTSDAKKLTNKEAGEVLFLSLIHEDDTEYSVELILE